ncbi:MAG TPA: dihydrofolate reductase [Pseudolabrys sp.]|jgi:dihydrofolate reductase
MKIVLVVAVAENNVIGRNGALPWHLKSELGHFRRLTLNHPVLMGRNTYLSIGKPLKDRTNIVLTRKAGEAAPGLIWAGSLEQGLALARVDAEQRGVGEIMVIGGNDVFARALPIADRLEFTRVHASPEGDVVFPPLDLAHWKETRREPHRRAPGDDHDFTVLSYERVH